MKISPVKSYSEPAIPTNSILEDHPELLKLVPKRWQHNPAILSTISALVLLATGVRYAYSGTAAISRVAPLFQHGDGRGAFGCEAVNPPVFLSEDEARQVIIEEAKRAGLSFTKDSTKMITAQVPITSEYGFEDDYDSKTYKQTKKVRTQQRSLTFDGTDKKRNISFEYVSKSDFDEWQFKDNSNLMISTVSDYDLKDTASILRNKLYKSNPKGTYAVFYDPMVDGGEARKHYNYHPEFKGDVDAWKSDMMKLQRYQIELSKEQLREQVKDFIKWLKAEGVI